MPSGELCSCPSAAKTLPDCIQLLTWSYCLSGLRQDVDLWLREYEEAKALANDILAMIQVGSHITL